MLNKDQIFSDNNSCFTLLSSDVLTHATFYAHLIMAPVPQRMQVCLAVSCLDQFLLCCRQIRHMKQCAEPRNCTLEQLSTIKSNKKSLSTGLCNRCGKSSAVFLGTSLFIDVISYLDRGPIVSMRYLRQDLGVSALAPGLKLKNRMKELNKS